MNYTIRLSFAMLGDVVPMSKVAEAMALHRTTGGGAIPWHKSTYLNMKSQYELLLLDAAKKGQLLVCDHLGFNKTINELVDTDLMAQLNPGLQKIYSLYSKKHHLNQWGATRGDDFKIEDIGVEVIKLNDGFGLLERSLGSVQPNPAPTVEGVTPAPVALVEPATPMPVIQTTKRRTWKDVASHYIVEIMREGQYATAKELYKALEAKTGTGSPFDQGTGNNRYSLFIRELAKPLALKTIQNHWRELLKAASHK